MASKCPAMAAPNHVRPLSLWLDPTTPAPVATVAPGNSPLSWNGTNSGSSGLAWNPIAPCHVRFWMVSSVASGRTRKSRDPWPRMTLPVRSMMPGRTGWLPGPELRDWSMLLVKTGLTAGFWQKVQVASGGALRADLTVGRLKYGVGKEGGRVNVPPAKPMGSGKMG